MNYFVLFNHMKPLKNILMFVIMMQQNVKMLRGYNLGVQHSEQQDAKVLLKQSIFFFQLVSNTKNTKL